MPAATSSSNTKYIEKKYTEEMTIELNNRFSGLENEYSIAEQEICDNQQSYEYPKRLSNKRRPQAVTNQYPENNRFL